jgi:hypothetical protein
LNQRLDGGPLNRLRLMTDIKYAKNLVKFWYCLEFVFLNDF